MKIYDQIYKVYKLKILKYKMYKWCYKKIILSKVLMQLAWESCSFPSKQYNLLTNINKVYFLSYTFSPAMEIKRKKNFECANEDRRDI